MESVVKAAEVAQEVLDMEAAKDPAVKTALTIVKEFIQKSRVMCYGGTAINNLLPKEDQFYDPKKDVPDYDFFSETPQLHATKIADELATLGYKSVEVKPGVHVGTFKVFSDFVGVADISHLEKDIFEKLWNQSIEKNGIHYVPPNFLRMSMYLELSRPRGDVSRWKKVYSRLLLLNKHYPLKCPSIKKEIEQRHVTSELVKKIEKLLIKEDVILLGLNAASFQKKGPVPDWKFPLDLLVEPAKHESITTKLTDIFEQPVQSTQYPAYGELLPLHTDIEDTKTRTTLIRVYQTDACHSYHETSDGLMVASIPTLLQFILSILYAPKHFLEEIPEERFICTAQTLIELANNTTSRRYKLLTPITCLGKQKTLIDMRAEKSALYERLKGSPKFLELFFTYSPTSMTKTQRRNIKKRLRKTYRKHY
jgi:hypothetical protein